MYIPAQGKQELRKHCVSKCGQLHMVVVSHSPSARPTPYTLNSLTTSQLHVRKLTLNIGRVSRLLQQVKMDGIKLAQNTGKDRQAIFLRAKK